MQEELLVKVYERQGETLARIEFLTQMIGEQTRVSARHGKRLTVLERKWTKLFSWVTLISTTITAGIAYLTKKDS